MKRFFHDMQRYRRYMFYSAKAQLKNEVAGSFLNRLWWILDPLLFMLVYTFVYSIVFGRKQDYLCAFIFLGYCSWEFFNRSINQSVKIVKKYKAVVSKVYLPKFVLILSSMMVNAFKMFISLGIVAITMLLYRIPPSLTMLWIIPYLRGCCGTDSKHRNIPAWLPRVFHGDYQRMGRGRGHRERRRLHGNSVRRRELPR